MARDYGAGAVTGVASRHKSGGPLREHLPDTIGPPV